MLQHRTKTLLTAFIFVLPLSPVLSHWLALSALIAWFFEPNKNFAKLRNVPILLPFAWFLWHGISSLLLHEPGAEGVNDVTLNVSFLLFPFLFATLDYNHDDRIKIIRAFINSIFIAALYCLAHSFYKSYMGSNIYCFFYEDLVSPLDFHPTYFGYYLSFAFLINLFFIKTEWHIAPTFSKILAIITQVFYFIFLMLLGSRIVILGILGILGLWFLYEMYQRGRIILALVSIIASIFMFFYIIVRVNFLKWRFAAIFPFLAEADRQKDLHIDPRTHIFQQTWLAVQENPILGIGKNGVAAFMEKIKIGEAKLLNNTHNQWLQTQLALGIVGTIILFGMLIVLLKNAKRAQKNTLFPFMIVIFVSLTLICGMTEAILERERGVLFFSFFYALLFAYGSGISVADEKL